MIKKSIVTNDGKVLNKKSDEDENKWKFPNGTRFMLYDKLWTVTELSNTSIGATSADNTEMRRIVAPGEDEILTLTTLLKDARGDKGFKFVDPLPRAEKNG